MSNHTETAASWAASEALRRYAEHRTRFNTKRQRDEQKVRAKHQFGDGPPPPPDPEPDKPTKMPVAV